MKLETVLEGLNDKRETLAKKNLWSDPYKLSEIALQIRTYLTYLADYKAPLHKEATEARVTSLKKYLNAGKGVTEAKELAQLDSVNERKAKELADSVYEAYDDLVSSIQTRIKVVINERNKA